MSDRYECGIRYLIFKGKDGAAIIKERLFQGRTQEEAHSKRQRFCDRIEKDPNFYQFDSWHN